jgi:hypothetical protein
MDEQTKQMIETGLEIALNNKTESSPDFNALCDAGAKAMIAIGDSAAVIEARRAELRQLLQRLGDCDGDRRLKVPLMRLWRMALDRIDVACAAVGR